MWSLLKSLFLTTDRAGENIETVSKGLDAIVHTKEEKANFLLLWLKGTGPTNVSRRVIAFAVAGLKILYEIGYFVAWVLGMKFDTTAFLAVLDSHLQQSINTPFMLVMGFYFAPHLLTALNVGDLRKVGSYNKPD